MFPHGFIQGILLMKMQLNAAELGAFIEGRNLALLVEKTLSHLCHLRASNTADRKLVDYCAFHTTNQ